jgi:hypothetical protein
MTSPGDSPRDRRRTIEKPGLPGIIAHVQPPQELVRLNGQILDSRHPIFVMLSIPRETGITRRPVRLARRTGADCRLDPER